MKQNKEYMLRRVRVKNGIVQYILAVDPRNFEGYYSPRAGRRFEVESAAARP